MTISRRKRNLMIWLINEGVLDLDVLGIEPPLDLPERQRLRIQPTRHQQAEHCVYIFKANGLYKIGRSVDPQWRKKQLQTGFPQPLETVHVIKTRQNGLERALHKRFSASRRSGEWFDLSDEDIQWIKDFGESVAA